LVSELLLPAAIITALAGAAAAMMLEKREERCLDVSFGAAAIVSLLILAVGLDVLLGSNLDLSIGQGIMVPTAPIIHLRVDKLSSLFLIALGVVGLAASVYSRGYAKEYSGHYSLARFGALFNLFILSLLLVFSASNLILFLVSWEFMSLTSFFLVIYEHRKEGTLRSGVLYLVMTHLGTAMIIAGLVPIALQAGSLEFSVMSGAGALMDPTVRSASFLLLFLGFGTKAGLVPLHAWLPQAHPAAPSSVSALMSGIMVKTAVFMLIRSVFDFLGSPTVWWGLLVLLVGAISALVGVLYALVERDMKKALAYSSIENVGIIMIALGASMVFLAYGFAQLAALALIAALLHSLYHALFKGLLFLGAGAVANATGTRDLERMGGLARKMKWTGAIFFVGVLSIAAIPPLNGFISEWLVFQSLFLSFSFSDVVVNLLLAAALGMLALTGALAAACFVRMYGTAFLARPRSSEAAEAKEVPKSMLAGMGVLAVLCILTGLLSASILPAIDSVSASVLHVSIRDSLSNGISIGTPGGNFSSMSPLLVAIVGVAVIVAVLYLTRFYGGRTKTTVSDTWDCGTPLTSRNEYTPTGFSQPVNRVFNVFYRSKPQITVLEERSPYLRKLSFSTSVPPMFERYLYDPIVKLVAGLAKRAGVIQTGSIQTYLAYIAVTLVVLLLLFR